ncbi:MAG: ABC transporter permease subunit [Ardenticatenaceae bacterium]|nr:ABC transporter permease subunit [Ardenticatenaceae bacterium]MCB9444811.1 ABC transporter permease subunit [Ardenticatenaceae bacterium]
MDKIRTIIAKEWAEVFKNRMVLFTVAFLPLILTALPLGTLATMNSLGAEATSGDAPPSEFFGELCTGLSEMDCTNVYMLNIYTLMFMMLPVVIPASIASYSIVGEKTAHSLEPILATPITTLELLTGKAIAAAVPAIAATWGAFAIYVVGARFMVSDLIFGYLIAPMWLIAIFIVSPLLTLMAVSAAIMVSSRVSDPRVAEQLSAVVILPLLMLIIGQSVGFILINQMVILIMGVIVAVVDAVLFYFSVKIFQREAILTRWK